LSLIDENLKAEMTNYARSLLSKAGITQTGKTKSDTEHTQTQTKEKHAKNAKHSLNKNKKK
jgi:hypothetical protein